MIRRLVSTVLCGAALLSLAACGQGAEAADGPQTTVSAAATNSAAVSDSVAPSWPAGCSSHSKVSIDYAREPQGYATPEEAALAWAKGHADGTVAVATDDGVALVDPTTQEIQAQVSLVKGSTGWWVDGVESCG